MSAEGRIVPPYPRPTCAASDCGHSELNEESGAYLHCNRENGKLLVLCGPCSMAVQMNASLRFPLLSI